jgi:membrane fusion protein, multidrug efflux system
MAETVDREIHSVVRTGKGRKILGRVLGLLVLIALAGGGYRIWAELARVESTDDAQIDGNINPVSARIAGQVVKVLVEDQQYVKAGDVLVELDRGDYEVAAAKARADLAEAVANLESQRTDVPITSVTTASVLSGARSSHDDAASGVRWSEQQIGAARARLTTAQANVRAAEANNSKAAQDVERYKMLVAKDEISRQQYDQAVAAGEAARATLDAQKAMVGEAQQNISVAEMAVEQARTKVAQAEATVQSAMTGPQQVRVSEARVQSAAAKVAQQRAQLAQAELNLKYSVIAAPVSGIVGKKSVEIGQNVSAGQQLMAIVPLDDLWVTANFKETQLRLMKPGQAVKVKVDAFDHEYSGKVERIAGASGARFSLLPPENATGNYVKVVQRIPVRIVLDAGQNSDHILRPGMSVVPTVQVR